MSELATLGTRFTTEGAQATIQHLDTYAQKAKEAKGASEAVAGVGRTLMTAFGRQLRGRAEVARNEKGGITARLIFPTPIEDQAARRASAARRGNQAAA